MAELDIVVIIILAIVLAIVAVLLHIRSERKK